MRGISVAVVVSALVSRRHPEVRRIHQRAEGSRSATTHRSSITDPAVTHCYTWDMRPPRHFYFYIMTNRPRSHTLYAGVTGNLLRRVFQHKNKLLPGFTNRYNLMRLVYYERFNYPDEAIVREKEIKGWRRSKKVHLIESMNPH